MADPKEAPATAPTTPPAVVPVPPAEPALASPSTKKPLDLTSLTREQLLIVALSAHREIRILTRMFQQETLAHKQTQLESEMAIERIGAELQAQRQALRPAPHANGVEKPVAPAAPAA